MLDFGILGMNARNLQYIKKFNPSKAIRLADNKFRTKRFLGERGIPVPATYDLIKTRDQLYAYDFSVLPHHDFIVKPVRGSRGRGIYRVKLVDEAPDVGYLNKISMFDTLFTKHSPYLDQRYKILGEYVDDTTYRRYLLDILDGKNSLTSKRDSIMLEETLIPGSGFETYCEYGLADIRVIVFNLIPVAAMLRVPTKESDGKANLDRGALGMGVEVGSGKIYAMYQEGKIHTKDFPIPYSGFAHQHLPYRDDILSYSSKIQYFANLGYLALDWVITDEGPKLLEINARAGLKFQNASLLPLRKRLNRIKDVKITTPEKGVEIAKTLFTKHKSQMVTDSKILYLRQDGLLDIYTADTKDRNDVVVEVDLHKKRNYLSSNLYAKLQKEEEGHTTTSVLTIDTKGVKFEGLKRKQLDSSDKNKVVLGTESIGQYYIKPIEKVDLSLDFINPSYIQKGEIDQLHVLDTKLGKIGRILNLSRFLKPTNFLEQLDGFVTWGGNYNPVFTYKRPPNDKLNEVESELEKISEIYFGANGLQSKFAQLFKEKVQELQTKLFLIRAYKEQNFEYIQVGNLAMYSDFNSELLQTAKDKIFVQEQVENVLGRPLRSWELRKRILSYLKEQGLDQVKVSFDQSSVARMTVSKGKHITIKISPNASFQEHELRATLAHEIDVHIRRYMNGVASGRQIMKGGTAGYLVDEEGLAVAVSHQYLPEGYEGKRMWYRYFFLDQGREKDFAGLASLVRGLHGYDLARTFNETLRMKKGIQDTSVKHPGTLYIKDKIYLDGYIRVKQRLDEGGDMEQLMLGKVKISDLDYII